MNAFFIVIYAVLAIYMVLNFKFDIQMLQQNSYRLPRYWRWLKGNMGSSWRLVDVALLLLVFAPTLLDTRIAALIAGMTAATKIFLILRRKYKKPLVFTRRVWRIYSLTALIALGVSAGVIFGTAGDPEVNGIHPQSYCMGTMLLLTIFSWAVVIAALVILMPVEKMINQRYLNDAARILRSMPDLKIIGVTGSYGKTSTKHYLNRILSEQFDVLMTPGSFNTPMGVVRTVREMMKPYNQIFICEMGAKQRGDVKEICDLVHPEMGIVTAVGPMHLESFKTIENVQATKFELVDALPSDGLAVVNNDFEQCANRKVDNVECERYAIEHPEESDFRALNISYDRNGTTFDVEGPDGLRIEGLRTKLVGSCNISNLLAAIIVALRLEVPVEKIRYAVSRIEQVEHRLNMKQTPGGVTIIDDAFNSNPSGSKMALDVLSHFKESGKRIVVTPGMIELGDRQRELNRELGEYIGTHADVAIVVGEYNREAITEGIRSTDFDRKNLHEVGSFTEAQQLLATLLRSGDTVLYENDLPDTFK